MDASGALLDMPKKKPVGRPKEPDPVRSLASFKGTDEMETWLDELTVASESGTRMNTIKRALRHFAKAQGLERAMPDR